MQSAAGLDVAPSGPGVGRPRSEGCRQKILAAADALLARDGFARVSVEAIAAAAGASKATLYRWWPNKAAIVMEALLESTGADVYVPTSADPVADLAEKLRRAIALFAGPKGQVFAALIGEAQFNPELAHAYRQQLLAPRRAAMRVVLLRAIGAGALRQDLDIDMAMDLLYGPLYARLLLGHAPLDEAFMRDYPAMAIAGLLAPAAAEGTR